MNNDAKQQKVPVIGNLKVGSYVIDLAPHCVLDATGWMLEGLAIHYGN